MSSKSPNTIDYHPPFGLRNTHVQTILSSVGPRKALVAKRFTAYANAQQKWLLDGGDGVRLEGYFNQAVKRQSQQLIILIHGWEGSHNSSYMK
jgi:predicted alpha/beta-fold hydrolase